MAAYYLPIKWLHISMVCASGLLFLGRGLLMLAGSSISMSAQVRRLSYGIDTVLLGSALVLAVTIGQYPGQDAWLSVKVVLLLLYIVLGSLALKRAPSYAARAVCLLGALLVYACIVTTALQHHPWGALWMLGIRP